MACHGEIDPLGLALENFDNTGRWRDEDALAKQPIDATTTTLTSGMFCMARRICVVSWRSSVRTSSR